MNWFLWGVFPYICAGLFFLVPVIRMVYRPFSWTTRASGMFGSGVLGLASLLLHWGLFLLVIGHLAGLVGGLLGLESHISFFYWIGLLGGFSCLTGSVIALIRRYTVPEVKAMSQTDDYIVHFFLIGIISLALYQVVMHKIFGVAYTASAWFASLWQFAPQPALMESSSLITKLHVLLALTFFAYFPFTKLAHLWTYPINFIFRPNISMRTSKYRFQRRWDLDGRDDKSWLVYGLVIFIAGFAIISTQLGKAGSGSAVASIGEVTVDANTGELMGKPLYVSQCARCHGISGRGDGAGANSPTFSTVPRDFVTGNYHFISTDNGIASDADLFKTIRNGLNGSGMPAFSQLSDAQIGSLVKVLNDFRGNERQPGNAIAVGTQPPVTPESIEKGKTLFAACGACHGPDGSGASFVAKDWRGLEIRPANLKAGRTKANPTDEELFIRISAGVRGGPNNGPLMMSFNYLPEKDRWALVHYLKAEVLPPNLAHK